MLSTGVGCSSWGGLVECLLLFPTAQNLVTQVAMYMGFTLGSAHTQVASRHALFLHGRCQPMSQASVNYRLATVCDAQCLRQACRQIHPISAGYYATLWLAGGPTFRPTQPPAAPGRDRPKAQNSNTGGRTIRSLAPRIHSSRSEPPPRRAPTPTPVQGLRPKSKAMPREGGRAKKIRPFWALSQNGIRHASA